MNDLQRAFYEHLPDDMDPALQKQWGRYFLKKDASRCGLGLLLILAVELIVSPVLDVAAALLSDRNAYTALIDQFLDALLYMLYMGVPFVIVAVMSRRRVDQLIPAARPKAVTFVPALLIGLGLIPVLQYASAGLDWLLQLFRLDTYQPLIEEAFSPSVDSAAAWVQFFTTAILAAVFEEFAFRGVVLQTLRRYGNTFALFASAFLFGLMHGNTYQMPYTFALGLVMGLAVLWTGTIWTSVCLHCANNLTAFAIMAITQNMDAAAESAVTFACWGAVFAAGLVGVILALLFRRQGKLQLPAREKPEIPVAGSRGSAFFGAPLMIVCLIVYAYLIFANTSLVQQLLGRL